MVRQKRAVRIWGVYLAIVAVVFVVSSTRETLCARTFPRKKPELCIAKRIEPLCHEGPITIFIHGTLFPLIDSLVRTFDHPLGLTSARQNGNKFIHSRIGFMLNDVDSEQFPLHSFFLFGWSGKLTFKDRRRAAHELYLYIRNCKGPITLIGHSHGGNVALHVPEIAELYEDTDFTIDRLILLATPVQSVTEDVVNSGFFRKVISLYSNGDYIQLLDPQGMYYETQRWCGVEGKKPELLSKRFFPSGPHIIQRRILINRRNPFHKDFIFPGFMSRFPHIIRLIETAMSQGLRNTPDTEYIINIPRNYCNVKPELLVKKRGKRASAITRNGGWGKQCRN